MVPVAPRPPHGRGFRRRLPPEPAFEPTHEELAELIEQGFKELNDRLDAVEAKLR